METSEVVQLEVLDHRQEQQEEDDERRKLAAIVDALKRICTGNHVRQLRDSELAMLHTGCISQHAHHAYNSQ